MKKEIILRDIQENGFARIELLSHQIQRVGDSLYLMVNQKEALELAEMLERAWARLRREEDADRVAWRMVDEGRCPACGVAQEDFACSPRELEQHRRIWLYL